MEIPKIDSLKKGSKASEAKETVSKKILFVLDYVNNTAYREDVSHINDDEVGNYVEKNYG